MWCSYSLIGAAKKSSEMTSPSELGMHYFMRLVSDEIKASKPIVRIPSLTDDGSTQEVSIRTNPTVFVIPGVEGNVDVARKLNAFKVKLALIRTIFDFRYRQCYGTFGHQP